MLTLAILIPMLGAVALTVLPGLGHTAARILAIGASTLSFLLLLIVWAGFDTGADWRDVTLRLTDFDRSGGLLPSRIDPARIRSVGLVAYGRDHTADLSLRAMGWQI